MFVNFLLQETNSKIQFTYILWISSIQNINLSPLIEQFFPKSSFCQINDSAIFKNTNEYCQITSCQPNIHWSEIIISRPFRSKEKDKEKGSGGTVD